MSDQTIALFPGINGSPTDQYPSSPLDDGVTLGSSLRTQITAVASATPHTVGSWVEVDAALSTAAGGIYLSPNAAGFSAGADSSTLVDIGLGAAASEVVWATVSVGYRAQFPIFVPGFIPSGSRVSMRVRSAIVSLNFLAVFSFLGTKAIGPGSPVSMGADTATSRGVTVAAPGALNTKGAWTQIVASTSAAFTRLLVCPQGASGTTMANAGLLVDIGIGAAASETVLIGDMYLQGTTNELYVPRSPLTYGVSVPVGSRLSARYARANTGNALDIVLVGA